MATKPKAGSVISTRTQDGNIVVAVKDQPEIIFNMDRVSAACRARAMRYGFEVRLTRAAALSRDTDTGKSATAAEKYAAIKQVADHLMSGTNEWNLTPQRAKGPDAGMVVKAMIHAGLATDPDDANGKLGKIAVKREITRDEAIALMASTPQIVKALAEIAAAASPVDADDLLADLPGDDEEEEEEGEGGEEGDDTNE